MRPCKLPPLIEEMFQRIGLIYEAHQLCSSYSSNPYIPKSLRDEGLNLTPLYRDMLTREFEIVKNILLEEMFKWEEIQCRE